MGAENDNGTASDLCAAMRMLAEAMRLQAEMSAKLLQATQESASAQRALRNELKVGRDKQVKTRRVKAMRAAVSLKDVPVDDIAAAAARRAISKLRG